MIPQYLDPKEYQVCDLSVYSYSKVGIPDNDKVEPHFDIIFPFDNEQTAKSFLSELLKRYNNYVKLIDRIEELEKDKARLVKEYNQLIQENKL